MADGDKIYIDIQPRETVSELFDKLIEKANELDRAIKIATTEIKDFGSYKDAAKNAAELEEAVEKINKALQRAGEAEKRAFGQNAQDIADMKAQLESVAEKFKTIFELLKEKPTEWMRKDLIKVTELMEGFDLLVKKTNEYSSAAEKAASAWDKVSDSFAIKNVDELNKFIEKWEKMNAGESRQDQIIREAKDYEDREMQKIADEINAMIEAKKFFEETSKQTLAELQAFNDQWEKLNAPENSSQRIVREAKLYEEEQELQAVKEVNQELAKKEGLRKAADAIQEQQGKKLLDNLDQQKRLEKEIADTKSRKSIAHINEQTYAYSALATKLKSIIDLLNEVKQEESDIASGKTSSPNLTRDVVAQRLEAIQRKYNEDLAQGKMLEKQAAEAKNQQAAASKRAADAIQMLSHVNQGLISSYNRIAEAGSKANRVTIQFQHQLQNYASLYGIERILKSVITIGGQFEFQHIALQNILGDLQQANTLFDQLQRLAVESPKTFMELTSYTKQLSAYQIPYDELFDTTKRLADLSTGLGVDMSRLILAYGQVRSAAVLRGQELRQFTEAGIPLVQKLAEEFTRINGKLVTTGEVFELISKRAVPFKMVQKILWDMTNEGGQFFDMQSKLADTLYGKWQKLQDQWQITLGHIADGTSTAGKFLKWMLELTVKLASALDTMAPLLASFGLLTISKSLGKGLVGKVDSMNGNAAIKRMELAMQENITRLERERVMYGKVLTQQEQELVNSAGKLRSQEYYLLAIEKQISTQKAYQLMQEGKLEKAHFYKLLQMQGYTREQRKQIANGNTEILRGGTGFVNRLKQMDKALGFMGGWIGVAVTAIGTITSLYSNASEKAEKAKNDAIEANEAIFKDTKAANDLYTELNSKRPTTIDETKAAIDRMTAALQESGAYSAELKFQLESTTDINDKYDILYKTLQNVSNEYVRMKDNVAAYIEEANKVGEGNWFTKIFKDPMSKDLKDWSEDVIEKNVAKKGVDKFASTIRAELEAYLKSTGKWIESQMKNLNWEDLYNLPQVNGERFVNRLKNDRNKNWDDEIDALNRYRDALKEVGESEEEVDNQMEGYVEHIQVALESRAKLAGLDFSKINEWSPEDLQKLSTWLTEIINSYHLDGDTAEQLREKILNYLPKEVSVQLKLVPEMPKKVDDLAPWQKDVQKYFNDHEINIPIDAQTSLEKVEKELQDKRKEFQQQMDREGRILITFGFDLSNLPADIETAINSIPEEYRNLVRRAFTQYNEGKTGEKKIKEAGNTLGISTVKNTKSSSGSKKDKDLEALKNRYDLYKKFFSELKSAEMLYGADAMSWLGANGFAEVFKWKGITDLKNYGQTVKELTKNFKANTEERKKFVNSVDADAVTQKRKDEADALKEYVDELKRMLSIMSENYQTYKKWYELTGDTNLAARVAGVTENTSYADYLRNEMKKQLTKTKYALSPEDVFGMDKNSMKKLFGENTYIAALYDEWGKNQQKVKKEQWDLYEEAIKNAKSYEDKIADINRKLKEQINNLRELNISSKEKEKREKQLTENANKEIAKQRWEQFKDENNWGEIFGDLDRISIEALNSLQKKLEELLPTIESDVTSVKELYNALDKIRKETTERSPFTTMFASLQQSSRLGQLIRSGAVRDGFTPGAKSAKYYGLKEGKTYSKEDLLKLKKGSEADFNNSLKGVKAAFSALQDVMSPVIDLFATLGQTGISDFLSIGNSMFDSAISVSDAFSSLSEVFGGDNGEGGIGGLLGNAGPYGAAAAAALSMVSGIFALHDKALQKEIEASEARQKEMENLTKNLEMVLERTLGGIYQTEVGSEAIDRLKKEITNEYKGINSFVAKVMGVSNTADYKEYLKNDTIEAVKNAEKTKKYYDAAYASLLAQRDEIQHQMESEEDKKNSDAEKLADYRQQLIEAEDEIKYFAQDMAKSLWDIDVKSWAQELTSTIVDAWKSGENAVDAYRNKVKEMMLDLTSNILSQKIMEKMLEQVGLDNLIEKLMMDTKGELDVDAVARIADKLNEVGEMSADMIIAILDKMEQQGYISKDESSSSSTGSSIKGITENTADLLAGYINAIRADVSVNRIMVAQYYPLFINAMTQGNVIADAQLTQLQQISANTGRNASLVEEIRDMINGNIKGANQFRVK